jgi:ABC-type transport system involved in multi-copper enzyme maturation permease subunit
MTPLPPGAAPPQSPFGWTGIKSERYTRWNGKLDDRKHIVMRMIGEGVRFNVKTIPVIILIVLSWVFSVMFPVLTAASGFLSLEATTPDTYDGTQAATVLMHQMILNTSQAEYQLKGAVFTNRTQFATINVPMGWAAYVNASGADDQLSASLIIIPPHNAAPMDMARIDVSATTGRRVDSFKTFTIIAPNPVLAAQRRSYDLDFSKSSFDATAGDHINVAFAVNNTGTMDDRYNITVGGIPTKWSITAFVNGTKTPLKSVIIELRDMPQQYWPKVRTFVMEVPAGRSIPCVLELSTRADSAKKTAINVAIASRSDQTVAGNYYTVVQLSDTKKADMTGTILFDSVMGGTQVLWTLLLAAVVGSKMIAQDINEKSYNLYFARPLTKRDYIIGKFGTLGIILGLVTLVPSMITYALLILLTKISSTYVIDHLWVWGAIIGYSLVTVLTLSTLSLAFSSVTARRFYAAAALVVIYLVTGIMGQVVSQAFNSDYARLISIADDMSIVGQITFNIADNLNLKFDWHYSLAVLAVIWLACAALVWFKVEHTELSE